MKLSVITMFCDGTEHLYKWIKNTQKNITIDKEIIIVDNTEKQTIPEIDGVKVVKAGGNVMQWAGRRKGVEASTGDYVFLVDDDDDVLPLNNWKWNGEDVICFNYLGKYPEDDKDYICSNPYLVEYTASAEHFFHQQWREQIKHMVWNKFIKKDFLMNIYKGLPYFEISFFEDCLLNLFLMAKAKTVTFSRDAYYRYYFGTGISTKKKYTNIKPIERLFAGVWTALKVFKMSFSEEMQEFAGIRTVEVFAGALTYALQKFENVDDSILEEFTKLIGKYFEKEDLLTQLKQLGDKDISRKAALRAKRAINDYL